MASIVIARSHRKGGRELPDQRAFVRERLRSPREGLGGFPILPRLIDKVRLFHEGRLPEEYVPNLLGPAPFLDGRFLDFTGLRAEDLRSAILGCSDDACVLSWVKKNGTHRTAEEIRQWQLSIEQSPVPPERVRARLRSYPEVGALFDLSRLNPFDLIDLDEGRIERPQAFV